mmetsp:Transcript_53043/g.158745  ORF Transcript_53043/g.158745 Transcript_53043/m.158745 type:complete len:108 (+) Transcript_53043:230-553(+)
MGPSQPLLRAVGVEASPVEEQRSWGVGEEHPLVACLLAEEAHSYLLVAVAGQTWAEDAEPELLHGDQRGQSEDLLACLPKREDLQRAFEDHWAAQQQAWAVPQSVRA